MTDYKNILVKKEEGCLWVTINRERALNALNRDTVNELQQMFSFYWTDDEIRAVVISGAGEKAFVAGADITEIAELDLRTGTDYAARGLYLMKTIQNFPKPVIAMVNGFALGGGCELAMACDFRIASDKARFGQPEVNLGIIPGFGGTQRLSRLVGRGMAMKMILTGEMMNAEEAERVGLVEEVVPAAELLDRVKAIVALIKEKAPMSITIAKECINRGTDVQLSVGCDLEKVSFGQTCGTGDKNEGTEAFLEKRKPAFTGH